MDGITIGAVGAAIIAGLVSLLGLVIGKEQKVSEFRQAWIDDLRKCVVAYLVNINSACDKVRLKKSGKDIDPESLILDYKLLNEASHGIALRVNSDEKPAQLLLASMKDFEALARNSAELTPEKIQTVEEKFISAAKLLLKFEWRRVKRGETAFVWTKWIIVFLLVTLVIFMSVLSYNSFGIDAGHERDSEKLENPVLEITT